MSQVDFNGDGDLFDGISLGWFPRSSRVDRLGLGGAGAITVDRLGEQFSMVALGVEGFDQVDVTGDGDTADSFFRYWNSREGVKTLPLPVYTNHDAEGALVSFDIRELDYGADLNGDGQLASVVHALHDFSVNRTWIRPWRPLESRISGGLLYAVRSEIGEAHDLNGNGIVEPYTLYSFDPRSGVKTIYPGWIVEPLSVRSSSDGYQAVQVYETVTDLNGDGDLDDVVLHIAAP